MFASCLATAFLKHCVVFGNLAEFAESSSTGRSVNSSPSASVSERSVTQIVGQHVTFAGTEFAEFHPNSERRRTRQASERDPATEGIEGDIRIWVSGCHGMLRKLYARGAS